MVGEWVAGAVVFILTYTMPSDDVTQAFKRIEVRGEQVFAFDDDVHRAIARLVGSSKEPARRAESVATTLLKRLDLEATQTWAARHDCEEAIGVIFEDEFRALDVTVGFSVAIMRRLTNTGDSITPRPVAYAISATAVRAHSTANEISALLRAAQPIGAQARWRTLHELQVVSAVLLLGNRYTASRYNNHRWVKFAEDRKYLHPKPTWPGTTPETMAKRLEKRYGPKYTTQYGWAERVVKQHLGEDKTPTWQNLQRLALLTEGHVKTVKVAHHLVHADALGALHMVGSEGLLHAGPRIAGVSEVAARTVVCLAETVQSLLAIWHHYDHSPHVESIRRLADHVLADLQTEATSMLLTTTK